MIINISHINEPNFFMKESEKDSPVNETNFFMVFNRLRKIILNSLKSSIYF